MAYLHEAEHLAVDDLDRLWLWTPDIVSESRFLGYIDHDPLWPRDLGPEPNWWVSEVAGLLDVWEDSTRFARDYRQGVIDTHHRAIGARE